MSAAAGLSAMRGWKVTVSSLVTGIVVSVTAPAWAGDLASIELTRARIQQERQSIVASAMQFTEDEALAFWPAYRDYRLEMARIGDRAVKLLAEYAAADATLDGERASRLLDEHLACQADRVDVRRKHARSMRKVLPPAKLARFFQLENKLDAVVEYELATRVPLAR